MADLVLITPTVSVTYLLGTVGFHRTVERYWEANIFEGPSFRTEEVKAPGTDGSGVKRHGFSKRDILLRVVYIQATRAGCFTALNADEGILKNTNVSINIPDGVTFPACEMKPYRISQIPKSTGYGTFRFHVELLFKQLRQA